MEFKSSAQLETHGLKSEVNHSERLIKLRTLEFADKLYLLADYEKLDKFQKTILEIKIVNDIIQILKDHRKKIASNLKG